ncbi:hypothetical protein GN244_ATG10212 [Phytophthora infestans]|uniref:Crinkler (CRN) family protein n=1 Tax=Phytophthora infestans TaxID=4787 RepID=A0A833SR14_PHYIN|nr:hypothetical protein GN244_ATG10212 [Phytophthora infestans]
MMIDNSFKHALLALRIAVALTPNITLYIEGSIGVNFDDVAIRLLHWDKNQCSPGLVSGFVARAFALRLNPQKLIKLAKCLTENSTMDDHVFEMNFFSRLRHDGDQCHFLRGEKREIEVWKTERPDLVQLFDPCDHIPLDQAEQWLAPEARNQGNYDADYIKLVELSDTEKEMKGMAACATTHSFNGKFFAH